MTLGERGGSTRSLDEGIELIEQHRASLAQSLRADIVAYLSEHGEWHRDNLRVTVPADSKNAVGAVVNGLIRSGVIVETGERRKSADPASHARKSNVYRLRRSAKSGGPGNTDLGDSSVPSGGAVEEFGGGKVKPESSVAARSEGSGGIADLPEPARLFEVDAGSYYDIEREAA